MFNATSTGDSTSNKKRVPDWLNSSLWSSPSPVPPPSSPPPQSSRPQPSHDEAVADRGGKSSSMASAKSSMQKSETSAYESPAKAPVQVQPPVVVKAEPAKVEIKDPLSGYYSSEDEEGNEYNGAAVESAEASPAVVTVSSATRPTNYNAEDISRQAQLLQEVSHVISAYSQLTFLTLK